MLILYPIGVLGGVVIWQVIALPFSGTASSAKKVGNGTVAYDNENGSVTAPIVLADGSIQINTVIASPDAPRNYDYALKLPTGVRVETIGSGLWFKDGDKSIGGVVPAWASDATGLSVPTWYEFENGVLTQVIDHSREYTYPIVGDPWIGINLFGSLTVDYYTWQPRVDLNLSPWGWAVYTVAPGGLAGQTILNTAGWDEAWSRSWTIRNALNMTSMRQQFEWHALGAIAAGTWNLEKSRPTLYTWWGVLVYQHHCNWDYPDGRVKR